MARNANLAALQAGYLFPEVAKRRRAHVEKHPGAKVISLGIGDTTEPVPAPIADAMQAAAAGLGTVAGYSGYGAEQGVGALRQALASRFYPGQGIEAVSASKHSGDGVCCGLADAALCSRATCS